MVLVLLERTVQRGIFSEQDTMFRWGIWENNRNIWDPWWACLLSCFKTGSGCFKCSDSRKAIEKFGFLVSSWPFATLTAWFSVKYMHLLAPLLLESCNLWNTNSLHLGGYHTHFRTEGVVQDASSLFPCQDKKNQSHFLHHKSCEEMKTLGSWGTLSLHLRDILTLTVTFE